MPANVKIGMNKNEKRTTKDVCVKSIQLFILNLLSIKTEMFANKNIDKVIEMKRGKNDMGLEIPIEGNNKFITNPMTYKNQILKPNEYNKFSVLSLLCSFSILRIRVPG